MHFLIVIMPEKGRYIKNGGIEVYIIPDCSILKRAKYAKKEVKRGLLPNVIICDTDLLKNLEKTCIIVTAGKAKYTSGMREPEIV